MPVLLRSLLLALLALPILAAPVAASPDPAHLPAGITRVQAVEGVTEYRLANGLQVLLYPDATKPTVTVNITYKVGSRMENYGETGMAHLLEHLLFKGSTHFPDPDKEFAKRGFHNNGSTYYDRTNYFSTFPATDDNLRWAIAREADAMVHSFIARKDLDSEMTVVRNEYEMGENQPMRVLEKRMVSLMFEWHNYGKDSIGNRSDIENVDISHLQAFYRLYYQPDNAALVVAGHFDEARVLGWIAKYFGAIPRPRRSLPVLWTVEPVQDGERSITVRRKGDEQIVLVGYHAPAALSRDSAALSAAVDILGDTPNGRLHHELVEKGLAAQVFGWYQALHDSGFVLFGAVVKPGDSLERARDRLIEVVETSLPATPASADELARVQRDTEVGAERELDDPQAFGISLSESIASGDWRLFFADRNATAALQAAQPGEAAQRYLRRDNRSVGIFLPEDHPQRAQIAAALPANEALAGFEPRQAHAAGESFDPSPSNIDARTRRVHQGELQLALLPKKTRGQTVNVAMSFQFGDLTSLQGRMFTAEVVAALMERGSADLTRQQIADEKLRLRMTGSVFAFETQRDRLDEALRFAARVIRGAQFPQTELEQLRSEALTSLQAGKSDPSQVSNDALRRRMDPYPAGDPRHYLSVDERIDAWKSLRREDVLAYYHDFWGTARGEIAVVGDFDADATAATIFEQFAGWKSPAPYARILREPHAVEPARLALATPDKENAVYRARLVLDLRDDDPEVPALLVADSILGGGSGLHNRLVDRIRQKEGLSYGVGSGLSIASDDRASSWGIGAIAAPQNIDRVEQLVREEIDRLLRDGIAASEFEDARNGLLQRRMQARTEDGALAAAWVHLLDLGRTYAFAQAQDDAIRALTADATIAAARKFLRPDEFSVAIAGDPAKGAK